MSSITELARLLAELYPLHDKQVGKRYRVVRELAGLTELEEVGGQARYVASASLRDARQWEQAH
ncbi:hypothetical protein [Pseudomonas sp. NW5]|uniref:hypothetical protein n=1 Tax=Pseudomonas sp. NW5 TaxID=2934934 RepID=UPI002022730C|nr:hypothetical protein [Pseudomonas sp. NW5]MCL7462398.1 hypothetical protein [Pseudomonas sp. NW5]